MPKSPKCSFIYASVGNEECFSHFSCFLSLGCLMWPPNDITGRDSSVGKANRYGPDGPGIQSRWDEFLPERPRGPPSLLYNRSRVSFPGVKRPGPGIDHPPNQR